MTPTEDIRDIRGPIVEAAGTPWWPYVVAGIVALACVVAIVAYVRSRRRAPTPTERAMSELALARELVERGDSHGFSIRVSNTVRDYVESAFDVHAPRLTTEELLASLLAESSPVAPYRSELGAFLEQCDLAKYARWRLSQGDMTRMVDTAETFVRATATAGGKP